MTLPVSRLINVSVSLTQPGALGRNFNQLLVMGDSNVVSGLERVRNYTSLAAVAADFGTTAPEYLAAVVYYEQSPQPVNIAMGRWLRTATAAILDGALLTVAQSKISLFNQITSGGFNITVDGVVKNITGLNFSGATNLNGVASIVQTALSGPTCIWNGFQFVITSSTTGAGVSASGTMTLSGQPSANDTFTVNGVTVTFVSAITGANQVLIGSSSAITAVNLCTALTNSTSAGLMALSYSVTGLVVTATYNTVGTAGNAITLAKSGTNLAVSGATLSGGVNPSSVSYMTSPGSGQDISTLFGMTSSLALPLVPGYAAETALQSVVAADAASKNWYGLMFASSVMPVDADNLAIAAFIQADSVTRLFGITIQNANVLSPLITNDLASQLVALGYNNTFTVYSSTNLYAVASPFGRLFTVDFDGQNTMIDLMYKQMPGIIAENLTSGQADTLQAKHVNTFAAYDNNTSIFQYAKTCGTNFIDETFGDNAMQDAVQTACYNVLYTSTTKVPQTDAGMNQFTNAMSQVFQQFVTNGFGAPGQWNAVGFGTLNQGDYLKLGYYTYAPPVSSQSEGDRAARVSVPFQSAFKLAGSTQTLTVAVTVNQ